MKKLLMIVAMILALTMMPFALFGCNEEIEATEESGSESESSSESETEGTEPPAAKDPDDPTEQVVKERKVSLAKYSDLIKRLGRTSQSQLGIVCDHTASGIEFRAVMKGDVKVKVTSKQVKSNSPKSYFTVYIDGVRQNKRYEVKGTQDLAVANFKNEGEHTIRIVKQSENNYTLSEFKEILFTGYMLERPADNKLYIEVIGDSITCGMGNIGVDGCAEPQSAVWEDGSQSYGYMLAEELGADYSIISESGIGLSESWDDPMVPFYTASSYNRDQKTQHDFKRIPDLVIVNLGTNDYFIGSPNSTHSNKAAATPEALKEKAMDFIELIKKKYGDDVKILWTIGLIGVGQNYVDATYQAVTELGGAETGLYFKKLNVGQLKGAQNHPVVADNVYAKDTLLDFIKENSLIDMSLVGNNNNNNNNNNKLDNGGNEEDANVVKERNVEIISNLSKIKRLGRTSLTTKGIACDHTASGIEFKGVMNGDVKVTVNSRSVKSNSPNSYFTVYVDGVRQSTRHAVAYTKTITVASFASQGEHTIRIVKQSETNYTLSEFKTISFTGYLLDRPADKNLYIEVIGDSITCGMGNIGVDKQMPKVEEQSSIWEDGSQSYGYMMAEALNADYSIISESGIGVSGSWGDHSIFDLYTKASYKRNQTEEHSFDRVPDLVIVNLATNDYFLNKDKSSSICTTNDVVAKGKEFVALIRAKYGKDVPIVWTIGLIGVNQTYVNAAQQVITDLGGEAKGLYFKKLDTGALGGAQNHPVVADNVNAKNTLLSFINSKGILS